MAFLAVSETDVEGPADQMDGTWMELPRISTDRQDFARTFTLTSVSRLENVAPAKRTEQIMGSTGVAPRPKRADNTGSAYYVRSERRWRAQFFDGNGKLRHLSGKTQQEVVARLDKAIAERDRGILGLAPKDTPTVGEYFDAWLQSKYDLKPKTRDRYRNDIDLYIRPHLGHIRLDQLKAPMIEALYGRLLNDHGLAPATVRHVHATLSTALRQAHHHDLLPTPLMTKVKAPRVPATERKIIPEHTIRAVLSKAKSQGLRPYVRWRLAFLWGLRQGEVLGLRWSDVDLDTGYIRISQQMQYFPGEGMKAGSIYDNINRFILPAIASEDRLLPLTALVTPTFSLAALRQAAQRGRLNATQTSDGRWLATRRDVDNYARNKGQHRRR